MSNRKHILVVEDDEGVQKAFQLMLEFFGYQVSLAAHGEEALQLLATLKELPAAILLDLMMPVMDGWTLAQNLARSPRYANIPIIVVTAVGTKTQSIPGARAILQKPVDMDLLADILKELDEPAA